MKQIQNRNEISCELIKNLTFVFYKKALLLSRAFFILVSLAAVHKQAFSLEAEWFGTTCVQIKGNSSSLLFDPYFTRFGFFKVAMFQQLESNPALVDQWLHPDDKAPLAGVLVSHTHFDHVLDLPAVFDNKRLVNENTKVYGSKSAANVALGGGIGRHQIYLVEKYKQFRVGEFYIWPISAEHPPHFLNFTLFSGEIEKPLYPPGRVQHYKMGESYSFWIRHPEGNILFHPSGAPSYGESYSSLPSKVVFLGIANRESSEELIRKIVIPTKAEIVIPVHHDNFFRVFNKHVSNMPLVDVREFANTLHNLAPHVKLVWPQAHQKINFQK